METGIFIFLTLNILFFLGFGFFVGRWWEKDRSIKEHFKNTILLIQTNGELEIALNAENKARQYWEEMYNDAQSQYQSLLAVLSDKSYEPPKPKKLTPDEWDRLMTDEPNMDQSH